MNSKRILVLISATLASAAALALGVTQLIPWSIAPNPPVSRSPSWDSEVTATLAQRAGCLDCHSNETVWPWYSWVAPLGWLAVDHVREGREKLNLSELDLPQRDAHEAGDVLREGEMPPNYYTLLHPSANLTDAERQALAAGLDRTLADVPRAKKSEPR